MICWARYLFLLAAALLAAGQWIVACGQKGDLYLPEPEPVVPTQAEAGSPASGVPQPAAADAGVSDERRGE